MLKEFGTTPMEALLEIMRQLRDPKSGCPWDIEQTFESIAPYTIEEAYEVADAIETGDRDSLKAELGDLLLQVVYHSQMAHEEDSFSFDDVARSVAEKMVQRHPHVFGDDNVENAAAQTANWEAVKAAERAANPDKSALAGVALALPALMRAQKLQRRAARVGLDWPDAGGVLDKIQEEAGELVEAQKSLSQEQISDEYGDLLFVVAVLGKWLDVDAEEALKSANQKFERRFRGVEDRLAAEGRSTKDASLAEMDAHWDAVKATERKKTAENRDG